MTTETLGLPIELFRMIIVDYLCPESLATSEQVCTKWRDMVDVEVRLNSKVRKMRRRKFYSELDDLSDELAELAGAFNHTRRDRLLHLSRVIDIDASYVSPNTGGRNAFDNVVYQVGCVETTKRLLENAVVELNPTSRGAKSALFWAVEGGHFGVSMRLLLEEACRPDGDAVDGICKRGWIFLLELMVQIGKINPASWRSASGESLLHVAAHYCHNSILDFALSHADRDGGGLDPNAKDKHGNTALHVAVAAGNVPTVTKLVTEVRDPDLEVKNDFAETPFDIALHQSHFYGRHGGVDDRWRIIADFLREKVTEKRNAELEEKRERFQLSLPRCLRLDYN